MWPAPCERLASEAPSTTGMSAMPMAGTLRYIVVSAGAAAELDAEADAEPDAEADAEADAETDALSGAGLGSSTARSTCSALLSGSVSSAVSSAVSATGSGVASSGPLGWMALSAGCASAPESIPLPARANTPMANSAAMPSAKRRTLPEPVPNHALITRPLLLPDIPYH